MKLTFAKSKKVQIETLKMRTDSLTNIINNERKINISKVQGLYSSIEINKNQIDSLYSELKRTKIILNQQEQDNIQLKNRINSKSVEVDDLIYQLKNKSDSLIIISMELLKIKESIQIKIDSIKSEESQYKAAKSFNTLDYDFDESNIGDFNQNSESIIAKEKTRIFKSIYAKRDYSLKIKLLTGETLSLSSLNENESVKETHYTYLFENVLKAKLYYVIIDFIAAGPGTKKYTLIELDLNTGMKTKLVSNIGGNFIFNKNETIILVHGWYDSEEYVQDNQLQIINILNKKIDLIIKNVEPININWLSNDEFQCLLLKYSKEKEWPFDRIPSTVRTGSLNKFIFNNGKWTKN